MKTLETASTVRTRLTPVGQLFGALMILFYVASVTSQSGLLLLFIGLIAGCFIVNWRFAVRGIKHLKLTPPVESCLVEGLPASQPWRIENPLKKNVEVVEIFGAQGLLFRVRVVGARDALTLLPQGASSRRGVYPNAGITLSTAAPYGLVRAQRTVNLPGQMVVFPRIYETDSPAVMGFDHLTGGRFRGGRRVNNGTHFCGIRSWQSGDSIKQVHWKTTARRDELMVKMFEEELAGRVSVVLDCADWDETLVDNAVRAAGSISAAALREGHHLEFCDALEPEPLRLAPFSDEGELLGRLARYVPPPDRRISGLEGLWRKSSIALVGTRWRDAWMEWVDAAGQQRRRIVLYLPDRSTVPPSVDLELARFDAGAIFFGEKPAAA